MVILGFDIPAALTPDVSLLGTIVRGIVIYQGKGSKATAPAG